MLHAFTSEDDATERATFAASASLFAPVTLTCKVKMEYDGNNQCQAGLGPHSY